MTFSPSPNCNQDQTSLSLSQAQKQIMDLVARRDHSEKELRQKLESRCEPEILDQAIAWANTQSWMASPDALKEKLSEQLSRRGKGITNINQKLEQLGLPPVEADLQDEFEKAKRLAFTKWSPEDFQDLALQDSQKLKAKIARFLVSRGFESDVVSSLLKNEFKAGALSYDEEY